MSIFYLTGGYCAELQHFVFAWLKFPFLSYCRLPMYFESDILGIFAHQGGRGELRNKLGDTVSPPWRVILWRVTALIESSARRRAVFLALTAKRLNDPTCNHDSLSYCLPSSLLLAFPPLNLFSLEIVRSQR